MITFEAEIKERKIKLYTNAPLKNAAVSLLQAMNKLSARTDIFDPRFAMTYGWARYYLSKRTEKGEEVYVVQTADYENDPFKLRIDDCTLPLIVQNMQMDTNFKAKVARPEPTTFKDTILVLKAAINAPDVYMNRSDKTRNGDSGWYFGLLNDEKEDQHDPDELITVPTRELLKFRGEALRVLQMPVGTVAVFHDNTMTALVDKDDKPLPFTTEDDRKQAIAAKAAAEKAARGGEG